MYLTKIIIILVVVSAVMVNCDKLERDINDLVDKLDSERSLHLFGGLCLEKIENVPKSFSSEHGSVVDRVSQYLDSHELKLNLNEDLSSNVGESRTKKLKKIALPLILALAMKFAFIVPIILKVLTLVSLKGLATGSLALLFAGASLVKDMFGNKKREQVTTAYITGSSPIAAEVIQQDNWNRNGQASAQEIAYNYHTLPQVY